MGRGRWDLSQALGEDLEMMEPGALGVMESSPQWGCHRGARSMGRILGSLHGKAWAYAGLVEVAAHRGLT